MAERPALRRAGVTTDVLSDVLGAIHLTGAVYFDFELSSPWVAEAPPSRDIAATVMPGSERVIEYHLIARGACWGHAIGHEPIRLNEGDFIVFPQGDPHVLSSAPGMRAAPNVSMFARQTTPLPLVYDLGGGGADRARIVCCFLGCDERPFNPLLASLPPVIHLSAAGHDLTTGRLAALVNMALRESGSARAGSENILARLAELMFVDALRRYLEALPPVQTGWLAGLRDPVAGQALAALHARPARAWTVEALAHDVGVSRSVLADRFTEMVGQPPMQYLALWRMQLASRRLAEGGHVSSVAAEVGYESEAAFSRAFKKLVGQPPGTWRRTTAPPPNCGRR
jgi:AraC-like DNA-binding protein